MEEPENKPMKKEQENPQNGIHCLDIFPYEMWREILSRLEGKRSLETLLNCRAVCIDLESAAEEMLLRSAAGQFRKLQEIMEDPLAWGEEYVLQRMRFERFITKQCGTRLRTAEDVELFLAQMEGRTRAPFPNGYVIYSPSSQLSLDDAQRFHMAFESLVNAFSDLITSLLYDFSRLSSIGSLVQLATIFKLKNLKNLLVCNQWTAYDLAALLETFIGLGNIRFPLVPSGITQLQFYGVSSSITSQIIRIFNNLQPNNITHLGFECYWNERPQFDLPPQLQCLEIATFRLQDIQHCVSTKSPNAPRLTELSVRIEDPWDSEPLPNYTREESEVIRLLRMLDTQQSETLEIMNWDVHSYDLPYSNRNVELPLDLNEVKYPRLKHFKLNYHILKHWRNLIAQLKEKFPILEIFTVTASGYWDDRDLSGRTVSRRGIYDVVSTLWEIFPEDASNLREIRVPCYDWILKRDGPLPLGVLPNIE